MEKRHSKDKGDSDRERRAAHTLLQLAARYSSSDEEFERIKTLAETDRQAFLAELGLTHQELRQLFMDLGMPVEHPQIDADAYAKFDPDEPYGWMRLAGEEPTEEAVRLHGEPIDAFSRYVVVDEDEAKRVLEEDRYSIPRFVEALDQLAAKGEENEKWGEFDQLARFVSYSRHIFPRQFPDLVKAVSTATHPVTRGSASFSLPRLMESNPKEAIEIWQRLLNDQDDPRVVDAAVMTYDLQLHPKFRVGKPLTLRQRRALNKHVRTAKLRLELAGYPRSVDLDHDD